ncbi:MAG: ACP S-malonyltransferase [Propionibacteriaceae bacterium]|nr:ACP S-malonyltransferase [Propionibacteriaceae bacterium]
MLAIISPGQGSQHPGLLSPWLELRYFRTRIDAFAALTGIDLEALGTTANANVIKATEYAQPLLVATALCVAHELPTLDSHVTTNLVAGHSVGELAAAALAGVLSDTEAMTLAEARGQAMAKAAAALETGMAAILLGNPSETAPDAAERGLHVANYNGVNQVVVGGTLAQIAELIANPPKRSKVVQLQVAGAFHTPYMQPAVTELRLTASRITAQDPILPLLSNLDGASVASGADYLQRLIYQITAPVRWDMCMSAMKKLGITGVLELPPAGVLCGLVSRNLPGVEVFPLNAPRELSAAAAFIQRHHLATGIQ